MYHDFYIDTKYKYRSEMYIVQLRGMLWIKAQYIYAIYTVF